jgi:DNA-binding transcriptional MerR regulator
VADRLLSIGAFARKSRLSMKALRLYDGLGLLTPADVDPNTGYRRYRESQLFTARLIVMLRRIDMPLAQVAEIVSAPGPLGVDLLMAYWDEVERRVAVQRELMARLRTSLLDGDTRLGSLEIREREMPDQVVLTEQRHLQIGALGGWLNATRRRLADTADRYGGMVAEQFVVFHGEVNEDSDGPVEVCTPIDAAQSGASIEVAIRREPAHREAYIRVTKAQYAFPQILTAYDAVEQWINMRGLTSTGPSREVYLRGVDPHAAAQRDPVCDVAFPISYPTPR